MYNDTVNGLVDKHPLELPEPMGPIVHLQEKLFVPVKEYPDVSLTYFKFKICLSNDITRVVKGNDFGTQLVLKFRKSGETSICL